MPERHRWMVMPAVEPLDGQASASPASDIPAGDLRTANQHLLVAGLAAQEHAEEALRDLTFQRELALEKENFVSAVAHDLKSPLTTIRGLTQLSLRRLGRDDTPDVAKACMYLHQIDETVGRMASQIDELLSQHQIQVAQTTDDGRPVVDLTALLGRIVSEFQETREGSRILFRCDGPRLLGCWDGADIDRIASNLLTNAIKYGAEGDHIEVVLAQVADANGTHVVLTVLDAGSGIPASDLPHIFERNFRGSNVGGVDGSGIGLSGVSEVVARYGGTVLAESTSGRGTTITVRLPFSAPFNG